MVKYGYTYAGGLILGGLLITYLASWPWSLPFYHFGDLLPEFLPRPRPR